MSRRAKARNATPRLGRPQRWLVERRPRFRPLKVEPPQDVVMLVVEVVWEHGQPQQVRIPFPHREIPELLVQLTAAWALEHDGADPVPYRSPSSSSGPSSRPPGDQPPGPEGAAATPPPVPPHRRDQVVAGLMQRMDIVFEDRPGARRSFVDAALRTHQVGDFEDLPIPALAAMHNQLAPQLTRALLQQHPS